MLDFIFNSFVNRGTSRFSKAVRLGVLVLVMLAIVSGLSACGKKPGHVDPPVGVPEEGFPHTYPDPSTDPKP